MSTWFPTRYNSFGGLIQDLLRWINYTMWILYYTIILASLCHPFFAYDPIFGPINQKPLKNAHSGINRERQQPNIVFILTDDQDLHMNSLDYMPFVRRHLIDQGTLFKRHFCTTALCCPSRVTLWTGKAAHNTNVTNVTPPYGMWWDKNQGYILSIADQIRRGLSEVR